MVYYVLCGVEYYSRVNRVGLPNPTQPYSCLYRKVGTSWQVFGQVVKLPAGIWAVSRWLIPAQVPNRRCAEALIPTQPAHLTCLL